jgi:hypothetical protein
MNSYLIKKEEKNKKFHPWQRQLINMILIFTGFEPGTSNGSCIIEIALHWYFYISLKPYCDNTSANRHSGFSGVSTKRASLGSSGDS